MHASSRWGAARHAAFAKTAIFLSSGPATGGGTTTKTSPPPGSRVVSSSGIALEKVYEKVLAADRALASQQEMLSAAQRQQLLLERRIAEVEDMAVALQAQVVEARRAAGQVALQQQNGELLIAQMEQRVLHMTQAAQAAAQVSAGASPPVASASVETAQQEEADEEEELEEEEEEIVFSEALRAEVQALIRETLKAEAPALRGTAPTPNSDHHTRPATESNTATDKTLLQQLAELDRRLGALQAYVDNLAMHKVDLTNLARSSSSTPTPSPPPSSSSLADVADSLAAQLRLCGAVPFTDATGATRLASQVLAVHNVPANMGAAEVRELCMRAVGGGGAVGGPSSGELGGSAVVSCVTRGGGAGLPTQQRVFHVTFATAHLAVKALTAMNATATATQHAGRSADGHNPKGSGGGGLALVVEPVVSADMQAALRMLEAQGKRREVTSKPSDGTRGRK